MIWRVSSAVKRFVFVDLSNLGRFAFRDHFRRRQQGQSDTAHRSDSGLVPVPASLCVCLAPCLGEEIDARQQADSALALVLVVARRGRMSAWGGRQIRGRRGDRLNAGLLIVGDDRHRYLSVS